MKTSRTSCRSSRRRRGASRRALGSAIVFASLLIAASSMVATSARAACNLIPVARAVFGSVMGGVATPITAPGENVNLAVSSCDSSPGFLPTASDNKVEIQFEPPSGAMSSVNTVGTATDDCTMPGGRCRLLTFQVPATVATVPPPHGVAGPARVFVRELLPNGPVVAEIGELNLPSLGCDEFPETVFRQFTVLPTPNNFADLSDGTTLEMLATVDGSGSLLVPFDYWGNGTRSVLPETPGSPIARFVEGAASIPANGAGDNHTILQVVSNQQNASAFARSFTLDGRPLPPLLRITDDAKLFGTIDAVASVIRIARNDGRGGPDLFNLSDRVTDGAPMVVTAFSTATREPLPLASLRSTDRTVAYARTETRENADLNDDDDMLDLVVQIVDAQTAVALPTGVGIDASFGPTIFGAYDEIPGISAGNDIAAFVERESSNLRDRNADTDLLDSYLRVFSESEERTQGLDIELTDSDSVNGLPIAASDSAVLFRSGGWYPGAHVLVAEYGKPIVSPDGKHIYVNGDEDIYAFSIDALTGEPTPLGSTSLAPRRSIRTMEFSANGDQLYVATEQFGPPDDAITVMSRNPLTGALTIVDTEEQNVSGVTGLDGPKDIALSPDGTSLYVAANAFANDSVAIFSRNVLTGELTFVEALFDGVGGVDDIDGAVAVAVSPDNANVYVAAATDEAVTTFERDLGTGELTVVDTLTDSPFALAPHTLLPTSDGKFVYGAEFSAIRVLSRVMPSGALALLDHLPNGGDLTAALSPGEDRLLVTGGYRLQVYRRDAQTGSLSILEEVKSAPAAARLAVSPDPRFVYTMQLGVPAPLSRLQLVSPIAAFKTQSSDVLTGPQLTNVKVAADRAIGFFSEEINDDDRNVDGDTDDEIAVVFDATSNAGVTRSLDVAVDDVAISSGVAAMAVSEFAEDDTSRNGDPDRDDDVLAVTAADGSGPMFNLGVAVDAVGAIDNWAIAITPEAGEPAGNPGCAPTAPPGGCDLNGDGDALDRVLRLYDLTLGAFAETHQAAEDFVASGRYIAFRTPEDDQPGVDHLNGDGADGDFVMQVYDLVTGEVIPTHRSARPCDLLGCDRLVAYKIDPLRGTVAFLTYEEDEGDLDLDGDSADVFLSVFSITARQLQSVSKVRDDDMNFGEELLSGELPFQGGGYTQDTLFVRVRECDVNIDVNRDGDTGCDDVVLMLAGDADGDGLLDDFDSCVDGYNPDGVDADVDGLGDAACDTHVNICPPAPMVGCKQAPTGKSSFGVSDLAGVSKDKLSWSFKNGEETLLSELGRPVDGQTFYQVCIYDDSGGLQPVRQMTTVPGTICGKKPCWSLSPEKGAALKNKQGLPNGIQKLSIRPGAAGASRVQLKARGQSLVVPPLPLSTPVTVQLVAFDDGTAEACWEATYSTTSANDAEQFKAKND